MKKTFVKTKLFLMALVTFMALSCSVEDGKDGAIGPQGPQGAQGIPGQDGADGPTRFSAYTESGALNSNYITATTTFAPVGPVLNFTKEFDDSKIEIFFNSNCRGGTFNGGASGILFEVRINGGVGNYGNQGTIGISNSESFISIFDVFTTLDAGNHSVQIYARTNAGSSTEVGLDPGGFGGRIIAKETF